MGPYKSGLFFKNKTNLINKHRILVGVVLQAFSGGNVSFHLVLKIIVGSAVSIWLGFH